MALVAVAATCVSTSVGGISSQHGSARLEPSAPPVGPSAPPVEPAEPVDSNLQNLPAQAGALAYGDAAQAAKYAYPGGLVVAGRDNFDSEEFRDVSRAGGTVLIYLDVVINNAHGRYHRMLFERSECGPATELWPGNRRANSWGHLNDIRVGSALQKKLECVLETMVRENPHMGGWFADDVGSRFWFAGLDWATFPSQAAYRAGAIELTRTFRRVADRHGLVFLVNGTWAAGPLSTAGGGYPNSAKSGNALADGGVVEHHDFQIEYFGPYGCSKQWASESPVTRGKAFNFAVTRSPLGRVDYIKSSCYAFVNDQSNLGVSRTWGTAHPTGLPSGVR